MPLLYSFLFFGTIFFFHWLIYHFVVSHINIENRKRKNILQALFVFLPLSFILASVLAHFYENPVTRILYFFSGLWYGVFINLLLAIGIYYLSFFLLRLLKLDFRQKYLALALVGAALLFSILGTVNVFYPGVKAVEVRIAGLPEAWQGKTIVQLSDVHLGKVLGTAFLNRVVTKTNALDPDLILITGDLFDGMDGSLARFAEPLNRFQAKEGIFYINGNHEVYAGLEETYGIIEKTKIKALRDDVVEINGLQIIGVSYPDVNSGQDTEKQIRENEIFNKDMPSILLFHAPASINQKDNTGHRELYFSPKVNFNTAINLGADLQLSGHTHRGQLFPFNFLTDYVYAGYDYGLHKIGDFQIYISSGVGVWGPTMRTSGRSEIVKIILR